MPNTDLKTLADTKFSEWGELWTRMQNDADLVNLKDIDPISEGHLKDLDDHKIPNSIGITLNDPAIFAWRVESFLNSAIEQIAVSSEHKRFDTAYVESFIKAAFKQADKLLPLKDLYPLNPFIDQQTCRRGRVAARCLFQVLEGELTCDITPWDAKYFVYWMDKKGLAGAAYKTKRTKDQIQAEYPEAKVDEDKSIEVCDIWTREVNEIWISGGKVFEQKNPYGYVPVLFHKVPMGSMLLDEDTIQYQGESIFFLIRDLIPELNRLVSIIQSINIKAVDHALQYRVKEENIQSTKLPPTSDQITQPGTVVAVPIGGGYELMPIGQLQQQAQMLHEMIQSRIDEGMGKKFQNLLQPKTATEIVQIGQEQETLVFPRLGTRGMLKQGLAEMLIKQVIALGKSNVKIGNKTFEVGKLKGEYTIEFKYHFRDPKTDIARTSMAASQRGLLPDYQIRRDTLQLEDPDEAERMLRWEEAERISPLLKLDRTIRALIEEADRGNVAARIEAEILCDSQMCPMLEQAILGQPLQPSEEVKPSQPLVPLMAGGG